MLLNLLCVASVTVVKMSNWINVFGLVPKKHLIIFIWLWNLCLKNKHLKNSQFKYCVGKR